MLRLLCPPWQRLAQLARVPKEGAAAEDGRGALQLQYVASAPALPQLLQVLGLVADSAAPAQVQQGCPRAGRLLPPRVALARPGLQRLLLPLLAHAAEGPSLARLQLLGLGWA